MRTLDTGGDKPLPYLPSTTEANPFLGRRGIRLSLEQILLFRQQLRALVRTGMEHPVTVLFPMVTTLDELLAARRLLAEAAAEVRGPVRELPPGFEVGVMIEVPALALYARSVAPHRRPLQHRHQRPRAVHAGGRTRQRRGRPSRRPAASRRAPPDRRDHGGGRAGRAGCGVRRGRGEPAATPLLVGLGVHELSMSPPAIPAVKEAVRSLSAGGARALAALALDQHSAAGVRTLLEPRDAT